MRNPLRAAVSFPFILALTIGILLSLPILYDVSLWTLISGALVGIFVIYGGVRGRPRSSAERSMASDLVYASGKVGGGVNAIVHDQLKELSRGHIIFNAPEEMRVGVKERIEARISKSLSDNIIEGLRDRGDPKIEEIRVGTFMTVCLKDSYRDNFHITALGNARQLVPDQGFAQWQWYVVPLIPGNQVLVLSVTIRIKMPGLGVENMDLPVFEKKILVRINPIHSTKVFVIRNWKYIGTVMIIPLIGWIAKTYLL